MGSLSARVESGTSTQPIKSLLDNRSWSSTVSWREAAESRTKNVKSSFQVGVSVFLLTLVWNWSGRPLMLNRTNGSLLPPFPNIDLSLIGRFRASMTTTSSWFGAWCVSSEDGVSIDILELPDSLSCSSMVLIIVVVNRLLIVSCLLGLLAISHAATLHNARRSQPVWPLGDGCFVRSAACLTSNNK